MAFSKLARASQAACRALRPGINPHHGVASNAPVVVCPVCCRMMKDNRRRTKVFAISESELKEVVKGGLAALHSATCTATDRIVVDRCAVGYIS
jgi:hypothetical protein